MNTPTPYTSSVSVPMPSDDAIKKVIGDTYDPAKTLNVQRMLAGTEDMYAAAVSLVTAVFKAEGVEPKTREMIILRAAKILNTPYEWQANSAMAKNMGLSAEEVAAAASDGPVSGINPDYVLVCQATDELSKTGTLTDATLSAMLARYDPVLCRKLILMVGWFNLLSLFLNGCRVPLETSDKIGKDTSPLG